MGSHSETLLSHWDRDLERVVDGEKADSLQWNPACFALRPASQPSSLSISFLTSD
jgi:hypothetical protein